MLKKLKLLFDSLTIRQTNYLDSMKGSEFLFDYVHLWHYKSHKINPNRSESYIDSPDQIKSKKAKYIQSIKKITNVFNTLKIEKDPPRITKIKSFINKYNWDGINVPPEKDDWKKIMLQMLLKVFMLIKKKYILLMFQNITHIVKNKFL